MERGIDVRYYRFTSCKIMFTSVSSELEIGYVLLEIVL